MKNKEEIRNSRGELIEAEEIVADLLAAVDHFFDKKTITDVDLALLKNLREIRNDILISYAKNVNIEYHCIYKHVLLAYKKTTELLQTKLNKTGKENENVKYIKNILDHLKNQLAIIRALYLNVNIAEIEDITCSRCLDDYFLHDL